MNIEFEKVPWAVRAALPLLTWRVRPRDTSDRRLFLTFDDGPTEGVTDLLLDILASHNASATFFCLGEMAVANPQLVHAISAAGHVVANHGSRHLDGWKSTTKDYVEDVMLGQSQIPVATKLFRPPYGRFTFSQWLRLRSTFRCIMWDVTSKDYRSELNAEDVARIVRKHATAGSIILFHDSDFAAPRMLDALPGLLSHFQDEGFQFAAIQ